MAHNLQAKNIDRKPIGIEENIIFLYQTAVAENYKKDTSQQILLSFYRR